MGHASTWKDPGTHITYKRGDKIFVTGTVYHSADGTSGTHGYYTNLECYFYSYYTATWTVRAPICIGKSSGTAWAFVKADSIISGGTKESYTVQYDANGGTGAPSAQTKYYATNITLKSTKPTRTGYTFVNWNTKPDGSGTAYAAGATYTANTGATLYAQWILNSYRVSFNGNGGTGAPSAQTKYYGEELKLSSTKPTRKGYTFRNWNTKPDGSGATYSPGDKYTANSAVTLYAQWAAVTYTIKYNVNGGSGTPASQTKTYDVPLVLRTAIPTRTGYKFVNWNTKADGSGTAYAAGSTYTANSAVTLYAQWEVDNICCVRTPVGWNFGIAYTEVEGKLVQGEHVYIKVDGAWKLGTR